MGTLLWKELLFLSESAQPMVFALVADKLGQLPEPVRKGERGEGALSWKQGRTRATPSLSSWKAFFFLWRAFLSHASTELPSSLSWKHRHPRLLEGQGLGCWLHHKTSESPAFSSHSLPVLTTFTRESGGQESPRPQLGNKVKGVKVGHFQRKSMGRVWQGQESVCKRETFQ